jgi:lipoprotein-anchoring transpeptidase ErfK/SrfK
MTRLLATLAVALTTTHGHCVAVTPSVSHAAVARHALVAFRRPGGATLARFGRLNQNGFPTVFAIVGCRGRWYRVQLPVRPNGATAWVRAAAVRVFRIPTRIVIHVRAKRLELERRERVVLRTPISTGAPGTPTPLGRFYVSQRLVPSNPYGPYGPAALGTSAFSPVLRNWPQGGPVGIHGTDDPSAIGRAVSHGCIRLPNAAMRRLFARTPAGTPVIIVE